MKAVANYATDYSVNSDCFW